MPVDIPHAQWLTTALLICACLPIAYSLFAAATAWRDRPRSACGPAGSAPFPPVSILKPVSGLDRHTADHFATFCRQDYPEYELLFAVATEEDPAVPIIRQLIREYPERSIRLLVGAPLLGPNAKVCKLARLAHEARYDLLVISDSDISVPPGYLYAVVEPLRDPTVGAATCLYRGLPEGGICSELEALGISTEFAPAVIVARRVEGLRFTLGATMATTRSGLAAIGGFETVAQYCADDFELGRRIAATGHRVELASCTVATECAPTRFRDLIKHELRWAITMRHARPWGCAGRLLVAQGLPYLVWTIWTASLGSQIWASSALPGWRVALAYAMIFATARAAVLWLVGVRWLNDPIVRRRWWLLPVRDMMTLLVSIAAWCTSRIEWRGQVFDLRCGRLMPVKGRLMAVKTSVNETLRPRRSVD